MNRNLAAIIIAISWFSGTYLAIAALDPVSALPAGTLAVTYGGNDCLAGY